MNKNDKIRPFNPKSEDLLDKLIERKEADDLGLLDLVLVEEIMNQNKHEKIK